MSKFLIIVRADGGISKLEFGDKPNTERAIQGWIACANPEWLPIQRIREVDETDIPSREFRNAWCDVTPETRIDIDVSKAKDIQLQKLRTERNNAFAALGFAQKLHPEIEESILSADTKQKLQTLRDITNPLKALDTTDKINCEVTLEAIRQLGILPV